MTFITVSGDGALGAVVATGMVTAGAVDVTGDNACLGSETRGLPVLEPEELVAANATATTRTKTATQLGRRDRPGVLGTQTAYRSKVRDR